MVNENVETSKEEIKEEKVVEGVTQQAPGFADFRRAFPHGFMKICPLFCMNIGCKYVEECWELRPSASAEK